MRLVAIRIRAPITRMKTGTEVFFDVLKLPIWIIMQCYYSIFNYVHMVLQLRGGTTKKKSSVFSMDNRIFCFIFSLDACLCNGLDQ